MAVQNETYAARIQRKLMKKQHLVDEMCIRDRCWGDVAQLQVEEGDSPLEFALCAYDENGTLRRLPYQHLLLFTTLNPEPANPYGVSLLRSMPFLADILLKIYNRCV